MCTSSHSGFHWWEPAAILQARADWEQNGKRDDMLLPPGLQLERARSLLDDPGDITTNDIKEFILLSSARAARLQRITRWAVAAVGAVILIAGATVGYLQWDKAEQLATQQEQLAESERQLATKEEALAESGRQLGEARASVAAEQVSNATLTDSLNKRQAELDHAQAIFLSELSRAKLLRREFESALRLAARGTRIELALTSETTKASLPATALAAAVSLANWHLNLSGHRSSSAAFSPDGSRIVTASEAENARIWDAA